MSGGIPILPLLVLYLLASGLALFVTRPSSGRRAVVLTLIIGVAMPAGVGLTVSSLASKIAYEASWGWYYGH